MSLLPFDCAATWNLHFWAPNPAESLTNQHCRPTGTSTLAAALLQRTHPGQELCVQQGILRASSAPLQCLGTGGTDTPQVEGCPLVRRTTQAHCKLLTAHGSHRPFLIALLASDAYESCEVWEWINSFLKCGLHDLDLCTPGWCHCRPVGPVLCHPRSVSPLSLH